MFRYAKNVRLASFVWQAFQMDNCDSHSGSLWLPLALTCYLRLSLALSGSYWISPCLSLALYGSLWLPLWPSLALTATLWHTLALSGSLLLSNFAYTALDRLTGPLLGALSPALVNNISYEDWRLNNALGPMCLCHLLKNLSDIKSSVVAGYCSASGSQCPCTGRYIVAA